MVPLAVTSSASLREVLKGLFIDLLGAFCDEVLEDPTSPMPAGVINEAEDALVIVTEVESYTTIADDVWDDPDASEDMEPQALNYAEAPRSIYDVARDR